MNRPLITPPKPVAFTKKEGGDWFSWIEWNYEAPQNSSAQQVPFARPLIHAVLFEDRWIFDSVNGWRDRCTVKHFNQIKTSLSNEGTSNAA